MLDRAGNADRDIDFWSDDLAGLADLIVIGHIARIDRSARCTDGGTQLVSDLNKGDVQALVVQNPMRMGYLGVMTLMKHLQGQPVEKRVDTGVMVVTPENKDTPEIKDLINPPLDKYLN